MKIKSSFLMTTALLLCFEASAAQASTIASEPLEKTSQNVRRRSIFSFQDLTSMALDTIAVRLLGKPADVPIEFDPSLSFWFNRALWFNIFGNTLVPHTAKFSRPQDEKQPIVPVAKLGFGSGYAKVFTSKDAPASEKSTVSKILFSILEKFNGFFPLTRGNLPPMPEDPDAILDLMFSEQHYKVPPPPVYTPLLKHNQHDLIAALSLEGPFANLIEHVACNRYKIDLNNYQKYSVKKGLYPLGAVAELDYEDGQMRTALIRYKGVDYFPPHIKLEGADEWKRVQKILLATMHTETVFFSHLLNTHIIIAGTFSAVNNDFLDKDHPLRKLMHPQQVGTLSTNDYQIGLLIGDKNQFFPEIFSYDKDVIDMMFKDFIEKFEFKKMDIHENLKTRKMNSQHIAYQYHKNTNDIWKIFESFVSKTVDHYYGQYESDEKFVQDHEEIKSWYEELERRIPNGISDYATIFAERDEYSSNGLTRASLKKLITTFMYTVTAHHKNVSQITYNYTPWLQDIPTVVNLDGTLPNIGILQTNMNLTYATNDPSTTLVDSWSYLFDDELKGYADEFTAAMRDLQEKYDSMENHNPNLTMLLPNQIGTSVNT